jgi:hypothetical protein
VLGVERGQVISVLEGRRRDEGITKLDMVRACKPRQLIPGQITRCGFHREHAEAPEQG